jgi:hypothetical protein
MLKPGAKTLELAAEDPLLKAADGIAFGDQARAVGKRRYYRQIASSEPWYRRQGPKDCRTQVIQTPFPPGWDENDRQEPTSPSREWWQHRHRDIQWSGWRGCRHQNNQDGRPRCHRRNFDAWYGVGSRGQARLLGRSGIHRQGRGYVHDLFHPIASTLELQSGYDPRVHASEHPSLRMVHPDTRSLGCGVRLIGEKEMYLVIRYGMV